MSKVVGLNEAGAEQDISEYSDNENEMVNVNAGHSVAVIPYNPEHNRLREILTYLCTIGFHFMMKGHSHSDIDRVFSMMSRRAELGTQQPARTQQQIYFDYLLMSKLGGSNAAEGERDVSESSDSENELADLNAGHSLAVVPYNPQHNRLRTILTYLASIGLRFMMVAHTHNDIDRVFSRYMSRSEPALAPQPSRTLDEIYFDYCLNLRRMTNEMGHDETEVQVEADISEMK